MPVVDDPVSQRLLAAILAARRELIEGLAAVERPTGWTDPTAESAQYFWTSVEVLTALVEEGDFPKNFDAVMEEVERNRRVDNGIVGWTYEGFEDKLDVFLTADVLRLMLALRRFDDAATIARSLQAMQNADGGWGVCYGHLAGSVHTTSVVMRTLIDARALSPIESSIDHDALRRGVAWLYDAQNDAETESGWGASRRTAPSQLSSTAAALWALLAARAIEEHRGALTRGLSALDKLAQVNSWWGRKQELGVQLPGSGPRRHIVGGPGPTFGIPVYVLAIEAGIRTWPDNALIASLEHLLARCQTVGELKGKYITPSEEGGPPVAWNTAAAIKALRMAKDLLVRSVGDGSAQQGTYKRLHHRERLWQLACLVLLAALTVPRVVKYLTFLPNWFQNIGVFWQSVLSAAVPVAIERVWKLLRRARIET